ncbi:hypothetical protein [Marixanthomonas ophiurae]|nr:hypothetical protein [Marixanthomonas ophiurae]
MSEVEVKMSCARKQGKNGKQDNIRGRIYFGPVCFEIKTINEGGM